MPALHQFDDDDTIDEASHATASGSSTAPPSVKPPGAKVSVSATPLSLFFFLHIVLYILFFYEMLLHRHRAAAVTHEQRLAVYRLASLRRL